MYKSLDSNLSIKQIYIDTSVFGGYFDTEFSEYTIPFFKKLVLDKTEIIVSETLEFINKLL